MMEIVYDKEYAEISYDASQNMLFLQLKGVIEGNQYRDTFHKVLEIGREKDIKYLLVNQATMQKSSMESKAWLIASWLPLVKKTFKEDIRVAIILSKNLFTKIGGEFVVSAVRKLSRFEVKTFSTAEEAQTWLLKDVQVED
ncbi:MAG: hypothetical protein NW226_11000 [Microscillaceae bacterium]|nr:hypothetical protein [Microscillaceae bacterium]